MLIKIILLTYLYLTVHTVHTKPEMCNVSEDCGPGFYCNEKFCHKCMSCDLFFRKGSSCTPNFSDCGECLDGYEEILITDSSIFVKPCEPRKVVESLERCRNDDACPPGEYCHQSSCVKCFDCGLFHRFPPPNGCAKDPNECRSCMNGFYDVPVTTNSNIKPCERVSFTLSESIESPKMLYNYTLLYVSILPIIFILIIVIFLTVRRHKGVSKPSIESQPPLPSAPPLYSIYVPENIKKVEENNFSVLPLLTERKQEANTAKVFRLPHASYYNSESEGVEESSSSSSESDEDTAPRSCTPNYRVHPEDSESIECSFRGDFIITEINSSDTYTNSIIHPPNPVHDTSIEVELPSPTSGDTLDSATPSNEGNSIPIPEENGLDQQDQAQQERQKSPSARGLRH